MTTIEELKQAIVEAALFAYRHGLNLNTSGNFSARDPETGRIFITPTGYPYERMTRADIVEVDVQGRPVAGWLAPSNETAVHCTVYRARPDVHGVVHTEPPYANCFGMLRRPIEPVLISLLLAAGGPVPVMPFAPSGSVAFGERMLEAMGDRFAVIWANHGMLTIGHSLQVALERSVAVEEGARVYHLALQLGTPHALSAELFGTLQV